MPSQRHRLVPTLGRGCLRGPNGGGDRPVRDGVDGSDTRLLLPGGLERFSFFAQDWSPAGEQIATQREGNPNEIWVIEVGGGGESWSPDGMMLVGVNGDQPSDGSFILDSESGEIVAEIATPDRVDSPSWQRLAP